VSENLKFEVLEVHLKGQFLENSKENCENRGIGSRVKAFSALRNFT